MIRWMGGVALLLLAGTAARADQFQIKEMKNGDVFIIPFATVRLEDGSVIGQTDKYGRMTVAALANGDYQAQVEQGTKTRTVTLSIDGSEALKPVFLE